MKPIVLYLLIGGLFLFAAFAICEFKLFNKEIRFFICVFLFIVGVLIMPSLGFGELYREISDKQEKEIEEIRENADNIVFFIDGNRVDYGTFDIEQYDYTYDMENNKVYMTSK